MRSVGVGNLGNLGTCELKDLGFPAFGKFGL